MSLESLSGLLRESASHTVSFSADGTERHWPELKKLATRVCDQLGKLRETRWAIDVNDPFEFAGALIGVWSAGKVAVVAPSALLHGQESDIDIDIDGILTSGIEPETRWSTVDLRKLADAGQPNLAVAGDAQVVLYTSGSTGAPKEVRRQLSNMQAELGVLHDLWTSELGACRVYSTVSHRHVYGLLFRLLWPLMARRPFASYDLIFPEQLRKNRPEAGILVASPALLKRIGHLDRGDHGWTRVFSSGGLLSEQAATESQHVLGVCPIEVLGSTETSGVAGRAQLAGDNSDWQVLPKVEVRVNENSFLEVRSPFSGAPGWLEMGDHARIKTASTFELLGRGDHIAKIEDKRVSLTTIEQQLTSSPWVNDAAAVALSESGRQFVGAVLQLSDSGQIELERLGKLAFSNALKPLLRMVEPVAVPKRYRYVDIIPVNAQGKREAASLIRLFE